MKSKSLILGVLFSTLVLGSAVSHAMDLFSASEQGKADEVEQCLRTTSVDLKNIDGMTALHLAAYEGHDEVIKVLIAHKAHVDALDRSQSTPLLLAASHGHGEATKCLIRYKADVTACNQSGWRPLHRAASYGYSEIVKMLIEHNAGVNVVDRRRHTWYTSLGCAAREGHLEAMKILIEHNACINPPLAQLNAYAMDLPLHDAFIHQKSEAVKLLLTHGALVDDETIMTYRDWKYFDLLEQAHFAQRESKKLLPLLRLFTLNCEKQNKNKKFKLCVIKGHYEK